MLSLKKQVNKRTLMLGCIAILIGEVVYIVSILIKRKKVFSKVQINIKDIMIVGAWEPYVSRYMLGYFAVLCPCVAYGIQVMWKTGKRNIYYAFVGIIIFVSGCEYNAMLESHYRKVQEAAEKGREMYFKAQPALY